MNYEQKLKLEREQFLKQKEYLEDWGNAIQENYRRTKAKWEEKRFLKECGVDF
ncbi:tail tapemeasure protein [Alteromonas phage XX1924]|nr:tail tapemeasure protein [Alteromonas phage XX1924]